MKKEQIVRMLLPAAVVLLVVALVLVAGRRTGDSLPTETGTPVRTEPVQVTTEPAVIPTETEPTAMQETSRAEETTETTEPPVTEPVRTEPPQTEPPEDIRTEPPAQTGPEQLQFPCMIPGTELMLQKVSGYDGVFLEDGQDAPASNVCAIVVVNTSDRDVEYAEITLDREDITLEFRVSGLTAGSSALVLEQYGEAYAEGSSYYGCSAGVSMVDRFELSRELVEVTEYENGGLTVTNRSSEHIPCVRIFYKFYMSDVDVYVGGITYTAKLVDLAPGASQHIQPSHYLTGMSRIVMVKTYDTTD